MLPNFETCRRHILAYKRRSVIPAADAVTFPMFWNYKKGLEKAGQSILDENHLDTTVTRLCSLFTYIESGTPVLTDAGRIKQVLRNIRPYFPDIGQVVLGNGKAHLFRDQIEAVYERMAKKAGQISGRDFTLVSKSIMLMAIWGQVPRFDNLNRNRFEKWIHWPAPEKLPYLTIRDVWYRPDEFREMGVALDKWVAAWPATNYSKPFESCFFDLCPGIPPGRQIDIIYHWKMPENEYYRLQSGGTHFDRTYIDTIDEYLG